MSATEENQNTVNQQVIDKMKHLYEQDPQSVPADWQNYFIQLATLEPPLQTKENLKPAVESAQYSLPQMDGVTSEDVTRSDLPPAPPATIANPTSPYVAWEAATTGYDKTVELEDEEIKLSGTARAIAKNMSISLEVPTATSARQVPAKLLIENRKLINSHLASTTGGKVSFTHLIAYALVEALVEMPSMNVSFMEKEGKPTLHAYAHVGMGLAIDIPKPDGSRSLIVPVIHRADTLNFSEFVAAYQELVSKARTNKLVATDFQGASITLTNPGTIGTNFSVPRLMKGQGVIIGVGATTYPAEWAGASPTQLAAAGVGPIMTLTSTYDHRVIQGAGSGEFLRIIEHKLTGKDGFYERVFRALKVSQEPYTWEQDFSYDDLTEKGKPARIAELIHAYRSRGHLAANTDPLSHLQRRHPDLSLSSYGLSVWDLDRVFPTGGFANREKMPLRDLLEQLHSTYSRTLGIEYMHIQDPVQRRWIQKRIERPARKHSEERHLHILNMLNQAEAFETFLQTKYVGQKRFSLEGAESLIPLLDEILYESSHSHIKEVTIGMAHRGRLNVLANIAGKTYGQIFSEFEGNLDPETVQGSGDVKYHLGTEGIYTNRDGDKVLITLAANPSHLEAANGVTEGITRAKLDRLREQIDQPEKAVMPVLIHGDAAFIGEGAVQETFNMSQLKGYHTGGTIHVIVNNQIGFTTGPTSGRSTRYCTDLAKGMQVPIFHVNADDPQMVVDCAQLAVEYRQEFNKDVIIDMIAYRRRGHNEGDDPSMTQPVLYSRINKLPTTRTVYAQNLIGRGDLTEAAAEDALKGYQEELNKILEETRERGWKAKEKHGTANPGADTSWVMPSSQRDDDVHLKSWHSRISPQMAKRIGDAHIRIPQGFTPHPKMIKLLEKRAEMATKGNIDWGMGELLAYGSLLMEGTPVRIAGQDSRRGTFAHRHAVLHDHNNGREWTPLQFLTENQARFEVYDSPLSEYGPLGFEYGYSVESPETLVIWEAQFGDFANCAQAIIDEFVASSYQKWNERSSVTLLLPHGYEGQGPDHSSARIERYLQLAAQDNMWICQPSTPANNFHMLRNQAYQRPRKPLIAFEPKQLLRLPAAASPLSDFTAGSFQPVIAEMDERVASGSQVERVLICSGRIYYDLIRSRADSQDWRTAIIRLEQLYPIPEVELKMILDSYPQAQLIWVQDEPKNQGPWPFLALNLEDDILAGRKLGSVSRPAMASPSSGSVGKHKQEQEVLLRTLFQK